MTFSGFMKGSPHCYQRDGDYFLFSWRWRNNLLLSLSLLQCITCFFKCSMWIFNILTVITIYVSMYLNLSFQWLWFWISLTWASGIINKCKWEETFFMFIKLFRSSKHVFSICTWCLYIYIYVYILYNCM